MKYKCKNKKNVNNIIKALEDKYPSAVCSLRSENALQLLIATRLSAQCTDARVNMVTPSLFTRFPTVEDFCNCEISEIEEIIKSCGLYKTKAKSIKEMCIVLKEQFNSEVPGTMEELLKLPGIGRKTANLILGDVFGKPAVVVDTHCTRICNRLGLCEGTNPTVIERQLKDVLPSDKSNSFCHRIVMFGRETCTARTAHCDDCVLNEYCPKIEYKKK